MAKVELFFPLTFGKLEATTILTPGGVAEAEAFTAKHPDMAISGRDLARSVKARLRLRRRALTERGLYVPPKERALRDRFRFGATE
ncbi:hypothetical protein [Methylomagnum ishizawai]|uniref:hypothetical protein n=1 Tax=Methylomagnum ishizawai TaxID=1760988 RepID=UPI001C334A28|nr:hypothetical protein [Methylomagnum ishizawai]BBL75362.1 hypothetical protein MishRS11D_24600 [Methylomagnum ishizawai]